MGNHKLGKGGRIESQKLYRFICEFGCRFSHDDLLTGISLEGNEIAISDVSKILNRAGLLCNIQAIKKLDEKHFPACVLLEDARFVVIVGQDKDAYLLASNDPEEDCVRVKKRDLRQHPKHLVITADFNMSEAQNRIIGVPGAGHWFWGHFRKQKAIITDIVLATFVANLLAVAVSLFALQVYDRVIPNQSIVTLWVLVVGAFLAIGLEVLLRVARSYLMDASGRKIELEVSTLLFKRLANMKLSSRPASPGSLANMMREFGSVREFFTATSVGSVADIPFVVIFLGLIYAIAGPVVLIIMAAMVLIIVPSLVMQKSMSRLSSEMLGGVSASVKLVNEMVYAHETVKSLEAEPYFKNKWREIISLNATKTTAQRAIASTLTFIATGLQQVSYVAAVVAGVFLVFQGEFTVGTIIAISILSTRTLAPVTQLSSTLARWQQVKCALQGLEEIANSEQERPDDRVFAKKKVLDGDYKLENIKYFYSEETAPVLNIPNLEINDRETVAVLGENGSGKSTLLKVMAGLYSLDDGVISIGGIEYRQLDPTDMRRNIGYLPQEIKLFAGSLRENLTLGFNHIEEERLIEALIFSGLATFVSKHPRGLDMVINDGGDGLSIGQRQSVGLARIFLRDPRIILLDEPTASLDQQIENALIDNLKAWLQNKTCILVTHRVPTLSLANRIIVMKDGIVHADGPTNTILPKLVGLKKTEKAA